MFWICVCCDRGQRYCTGECRGHVRRRQRQAANRRHQQSAEGRLDHRDRQRAYRCGQLLRRVTEPENDAVQPGIDPGCESIVHDPSYVIGIRGCVSPMRVARQYTLASGGGNR